MTDQDLIDRTAVFIQSELANAEAGHNWFHIERVWRNARTIARSENVNLLVVELGALLHDIADHKFNNGDESAGVSKARRFLERLPVEESVICHVEKIIMNTSFSGGNFSPGFFSMELAVVQDADRLDALGAIGIARAFHYGGYKGRELYNPAIKPELDMTIEQYRNSKGPTLNHFYEKLLLLKDRMNTGTGRKMAEQRHRYMEEFLEQFFREWKG
jgi:uncharacterized protein